MANDVRQPIDISSLERYLSSAIPNIKSPIQVKQFGYGQSNPTYLLSDNNGIKYVLRKKPPGKLLSKTAHQVDREYRIMHALETTEVPVPKTYCICEDEQVIGTPFYVMEFLDGRIFEDPVIPGVSPKDRMSMWKDAIQCLAKLHRTNRNSVGLKDFGKPTGFYNRQLKTFQAISQSQASIVDVESGKAVGSIPHFLEMVAFFSETGNQPTDRGSLVHGDYKIDNIVFHPTEPRVLGIIDWEMSTVGHPLSDVVNLLTPYATANAPKALSLGRGSEAFRTGRTPGLPSIAQLTGWYQEVAGWDPSPDLPWGNGFGFWKNSIIMQGIAARYAQRQASSAKAKDYVDYMVPFGEATWKVVQDVQRQKRNAKL